MTARRRVAVIPAYEAAKTAPEVVRGLRRLGFEAWVCDDGSRDDTARAAADAGARVVRHPRNRGKSAALRTLLHVARAEGVDAVVTLDADGQHPPEEARRLDDSEPDRRALVLGVRDLDRDGAPTANQRGNAISNGFLSLFSGLWLRDTNCGLRRYPVELALSLGVDGERFTFEAEIVLRAARAGARIVEVPVRVLYPSDRTTHFHVVRDPARIVARVVETLVTR